MASPSSQPSKRWSLPTSSTSHNRQQYSNWHHHGHNAAQSIQINVHVLALAQMPKSATTFHISMEMQHWKQCRLPFQTSPRFISPKQLGKIISWGHFRSLSSCCKGVIIPYPTLMDNGQIIIIDGYHPNKSCQWWTANSPSQQDNDKQQLIILVMYWFGIDSIGNTSIIVNWYLISMTKV